MIVVRYAVFSERDHKPLTRAVCDSRVEAERALEAARREDSGDAATTYWVGEVGPEGDAWRFLGREGTAGPEKR